MGEQHGTRFIDDRMWSGHLSLRQSNQSTRAIQLRIVASSILESLCLAEFSSFSSSSSFFLDLPQRWTTCYVNRLQDLLTEVIWVSRSNHCAAQESCATLLSRWMRHDDRFHELYISFQASWQHSVALFPPLHLPIATILRVGDFQLILLFHLHRRDFFQSDCPWTGIGSTLSTSRRNFFALFAENYPPGFSTSDHTETFPICLPVRGSGECVV
ncbi:hypothetical protein B0J11DRAFT_66399 [Dendryphion nanum]|uniref:Uncharacterized protein n=1 Tax=Dendryphion nanum TaxID=256645 RepID=A0A9P9DIM7_9PLEO|nr:hypothetical protein B0J11DRAFT_66399 [Dendryphion nanum]